MNQVNIVGRLGADADLRYRTTSQKAVARMSIAVNDRYGETEQACPRSAPPSGEPGGSTGVRSSAGMNWPRP